MGREKKRCFAGDKFKICSWRSIQIKYEMHEKLCSYNEGKLNVETTPEKRKNCHVAYKMHRNAYA